MAAIREHTESIIQELSRSLSTIDERQVGQLAARIVAARKIFAAGAGRSGLMVRAFAMRLMHLGLTVHVVGEAVTPGLAAEDLLLIASGSGETRSLVGMAEKAKSIGASVAAVTIQPASSIGKLADTIVTIAAATKDAAGGGHTTIQPMGSLYEQTLLLLFDAVILRLMDTQELNSAAMFGNHANLE